MKYEVRLRGGFSDRKGIAQENIEMQTDDLDERSRVTIGNTIKCIFKELELYDSNQVQVFLKNLLSKVYMTLVDYTAFYRVQVILDTVVIKTILEDDYDKVLTVVEYIVRYLKKNFNQDLGTIFNESVFEPEYIGYRFVDGIITPIISQVEIEAIEAAVTSPFDSVNNQLEKAIILFSDREKADYENTIKESICAVEAMCCRISGKKDSLGAALKALEKNGKIIHPALKEGFEKLFGYTSDAKGIRHAGGYGGPFATFEEAKFMLVSCSAFINYLVGMSSD